MATYLDRILEAHRAGAANDARSVAELRRRCDDLAPARGFRQALASVDPADPTMVHIQQVCRATSGERSGVGVFEQLVIGPHVPSGFSGLTDGAV